MYPIREATQLKESHARLEQKCATLQVEKEALQKQHAEATASWMKREEGHRKDMACLLSRNQASEASVSELRGKLMQSQQQLKTEQLQTAELKKEKQHLNDVIEPVGYSCYNSDLSLTGLPLTGLPLTFAYSHVYHYIVPPPPMAPL